MEGDRVDKEVKDIAELISSRSDGAITIEATVSTGFEFMAVDECRKKFGADVQVLKERGRIVFNIDKSQYDKVPQMRSVDSLYLVISCSASIGLKGEDSAADLLIVKTQAHVPDWDYWLPIWCDMVGFKGITKPTLEQYEVANARAKVDKQREKERQGERQQRHKERQQRQATLKAQRQARADQKRAERAGLVMNGSEESTQISFPLVTDNEMIPVESDSKVELESAGEKLDIIQPLVADVKLDDSLPPSADEISLAPSADIKLDISQLPSEDGKSSASSIKDTDSVPEVEIKSGDESNEDGPACSDVSNDNVEVAEMHGESNSDTSSSTIFGTTEDASDGTGMIADKQEGIPAVDVESNCGDAAEVESLPEYERETERGEIAPDIPPNEQVMRFRATCFRTGKHSFGSTEAACEFGGDLQSKFNWVVDLTNFHSEVVLTLHKDSAQVGLALTKQSLHRRNIAFFGPTTLRATICHNMLRMADVKPGDVVIDPMAGGGSIPIEGAMSFPGVFMVGGDSHPKAVDRAYSNVRVLQKSLCHGLPLDNLRWDARRLPLKEACADVVVSDLPFGVRVGSKSSNRGLYCKVLCEMARITRPGTGRAILLTQDRKSFALALCQTFGLWWQSHVMSANIGGLDAAVFTLRRTSKVRPDEADLAKGAEKEKGSWRGGPPYGGPRGRRGQNWGHGRGHSYPRSGRQGGGSSGNWRDRPQQGRDHNKPVQEKEAS